MLNTIRGIKEAAINIGNGIKDDIAGLKEANAYLKDCRNIGMALLEEAIAQKHHEKANKYMAKAKGLA